MNKNELQVIQNEETYNIKLVKVEKNGMICVNSKTIWDIRSGRPNGIRYTTTSSRLLDLSEFVKKENPIILLTNKPYRITQAINESDVEFITDKNKVHNIMYTHNINEIGEIISVISKKE